MNAALRLFGALGLLVGLHACGGTSRPAPIPSRPAGPYIKLADRQTALLIYADRALSGAEQGALVDALRDRLRTIYRNEVTAQRVSGAFARLEPDRLARYALAGIDDAVVVEVSAVARDTLQLRTRVINLTQLRTVLDISTPPIRGLPGPKRARRIAETVARRLSKRWTDPGADPEMNAIQTADRLADNRACRAALKIYERVMPGWRPTTVVDVERYESANERYERCGKRVRFEDAMAADAEAKFSLTVDATSVAPRIAAAMEKSLRQTRLTANVRAWTDKPAFIRVSPELLSLEMRLDPGRYRQSIQRRPKYEAGRPILYLDPFMDLIEGVLELRDLAVEALPPYDRINVQALQTQLRFVRLPEDQVIMVFSDLDGRLLISSGLFVKVGRRPEVKVESLSTGVSRSLKMLLGPPEDTSGAVTDYGLVFRFFGLE